MPPLPPQYSQWRWLVLSIAGYNTGMNAVMCMDYAAVSSIAKVCYEINAIRTRKNAACLTSARAVDGRCQHRLALLDPLACGLTRDAPGRILHGARAHPHHVRRQDNCGLTSVLAVLSASWRGRSGCASTALAATASELTQASTHGCRSPVQCRRRLAALDVCPHAIVRSLHPLPPMLDCIARFCPSLLGPSWS